MPPVNHTQRGKRLFAGTAGAAAGAESLLDEPEDELFKEAVEVVCRHDRASASLLQRRLRIGYARAARLLDEIREAIHASGQSRYRIAQGRTDDARALLGRAGRLDPSPATRGRVEAIEQGMPR